MTELTFIIPTILKTTLGDSVQSLLDQTDDRWNAIVCGDGMWPGLFYDERIQSIYGPHFRDQSRTRMHAIDHARTEWVAFLDDDDVVDKNYVAWFYELKEDNDVLVFQMKNYGNVIPQGNEIRHGGIGISYAVKTSVMLENPFPPPPSEDFLLLKDLQNKGYKIGFANRLAYYVRPWLNV